MRPSGPRPKSLGNLACNESRFPLGTPPLSRRSYHLIQQSPIVAVIGVLGADVRASESTSALSMLSLATGGGATLRAIANFGEQVRGADSNCIGGNRRHCHWNLHCFGLRGERAWLTETLAISPPMCTPAVHGGFALQQESYEQKYPRSKDDPALWEIWVQVWFFYSDVKTHTLTGKRALNDERRAFIERCILFLKSNAEFEWPRQKFRPWYGILRLLGFGRTLKRREEAEMSIGDKDVWPFLKKAHTRSAHQ